jgi:hypothetical protein
MFFNLVVYKYITSDWSSVERPISFVDHKLSASGRGTFLFADQSAYGVDKQ